MCGRDNYIYHLLGVLMRLFSLSHYTLGVTFFRKKVSKKPAPKEIVAGPPLLVRQQCAHSVGGLLVIAVYDCFKGAAEL